MTERDRRREVDALAAGFEVGVSGSWWGRLYCLNLGRHAGADDSEGEKQQKKASTMGGVEAGRA